MAVESIDMQSVLDALMVIILAIIAWYNQKRTTAAITTAEATVKTAATNAEMATPAFVVVTGPWDGGTDPNSKDDNISSKAGTRVIIDEQAGAFQLIDDRIAQDFIVASSGKNSGASGQFKFSGNLALVTRGKLL